MICQDPKCGATARLGHHQYGTTVGAFTHCPVCGGKAHSTMDNDTTYWESMAELYDLTPQIVKLMYHEWDRTTHHKFSDFVAEMKRNAGL